jgi:hypothetical protein
MIVAIIFCCSTVAVCQFGLYYWRAIISSVAAQPVSDRLQTAVGIASTGMSPHGFRVILSLLNMAPDLRGLSGGLRAIRTYYLVVETLGRFIPWLAGWSENEMATCSRYVAVLLDQRLGGNMACTAEISNI